jgi:hypothetical protein
MRTTLEIDDDVLRAAKELARREKKTAGAVISELARRSLTSAPTTARAAKSVRGFRPFPKRGAVVTNAQIDKLREEDAF